MKTQKKTGQILSVAGGKGGVGKSIFSIGLGILLAKTGFKVVMVDLDLGASNLHTYLGVLKKTPTISDFILKKVSSLADIIVKTSQENLGLISGADFVPGMANPAYWMKLKIIRHLRSLPADFVVIDLGAGANFNTLDFFNICDTGFVVTMPEPGAIMNAYSFIKSALFRKLQSIFKKHPEIGPLIESETKMSNGEKTVTLEWLSARIKEIDPEMFPLIDEIGRLFQPVLVVNRAPEGARHLLIENLINLCSDKLGITVRCPDNLPDTKAITSHLLNIPGLYDTAEGKPFFDSVRHILDRLDITDEKVEKQNDLRRDFSDEEIEEIIGFIDTLDESIFEGTTKNICKLRMFYKPNEVLNFLAKKGVTHELFAAS